MSGKKFILFVVLTTVLNGIPDILSAQEFFGFQSTFTHENDFLGLNNADDNYTGGVAIEFVFPEIDFNQPFYKFKNGKHFQIIALGATAYTPQDLESSGVVLGDRPYASLTYLNFGKLSISADFKKQITSQLIIGLTGWQGPGEAQYYIHDNGWFGSTRPNPQGWDNQIGYNGSLIVNYNVRWTQEFNFNYEEKVKLELFRPYWILGADVGNYMIDAKAGLFVNILNLNSFPVLGGNDAKIPTKRFMTTASSDLERKAFRLHVYMEPKLNLVGYDVTLQGLLFNDQSVYTIDGSDINRLVFDLRTGLKLLIADRFIIGYDHMIRTREFDGGKKVHYWGGITLGYAPLKWITKSK